MGTRDPRVDAYIEKSADFAKPILIHIRTIVHEGCPEVQETMKWSLPHFDYEGVLCGMAAFKGHCAFGFWKGALIVGTENKKDAMGQFGSIKKISDLPPKKTLVGFVKQAVKLNEDGIKSPTRSKPKEKKPEASVPDDLTAALQKHKKAKAAFDGFSPSHRREYVEWITEAKSEATREKRVTTAVEWMSEGKARNWKYER